MSTYEIELPEIRYDHDTYDGPTVTIDIDEAPFPGTVFVETDGRLAVTGVPIPFRSDQDALNYAAALIAMVNERRK